MSDVERVLWGLHAAAHGDEPCHATLFADTTDYDANYFASSSSFGAFYGALIVSKECAKVLWKSQPIWAFVIVGFLIYKANMCNIALHRNGRHPIWAGKALTTLAFGKFLADCVLLVTISKRTPMNIVLASIDIMASIFMLFYFKADDDQESLKRRCQFESSESSS